MRMLTFFVSATLALLVGAAPLRAQQVASDTADYGCFDDNSATTFKTIEGCTALLAEGDLDANTRLRALATRGTAYMTAKQTALAEEDFAAAIQMNARDLRLRFHYGQILLLRKKFEPAAEQFSLVLKGDANSIWAMYHRAQCYRNMGRYDTAIGEMEKAVALYERRFKPPGSPPVYLELGESLLLNGDYQQALRLANMSLQDGNIGDFLADAYDLKIASMESYIRANFVDEGQLDRIYTELGRLKVEREVWFGLKKS